MISTSNIQNNIILGDHFVRSPVYKINQILKISESINESGRIKFHARLINLYGRNIYMI